MGATLLFPATSGAEEPTPQAENAPTVFAKTISIQNGSDQSEIDLTSIIEAYEGRALTRDDLQKLTNDITLAYEKSGFFLTRAAIARQSFADGLIIVTLSKGTIDKVTTTTIDPGFIQKIYEDALKETMVTRKTFARALESSRRIDGYRLTNVDLKPLENGAHELELAYEKKKIDARIDATNIGSRITEPWRTLLSVKISSLAKIGDALSLSYLTKPASLRDIQFFAGRYTLPINAKGTAVFFEGTVSNSAPGINDGIRELRGDLRRFAVGVSHPVILNARESLFVNGSLELLSSTENEDSVNLSKDKFRLLNLNSVFTKSIGGSNGEIVQVSAELTQGVDIFNASDTPGDRTTRNDANAQFTKFSGRALLRKNITDRIGFTGAVYGQVSSDPLLFLEEFSFGGGNFGRGYDFGEIIGDSGVGAYSELSLNGSNLGFVKQWQVYSFADVGAVWNKGDGLSIDGTPLYSAGAGVRLNIRKNLFIGYEAAHPLSDAPFTDRDFFTRHRVQLSLSN